MAAPRKSAAALRAKSKQLSGKPRTVKRVAPAGNPLDPARVEAILAGLAKAYPEADCALVHGSAWELLAATILSAQCTDARVNKVTPELFRKYTTVEEVAALTPAALEPEIRTTGFFRNKAKSITGAAQRIVTHYGGQVPDTMLDLLTLPGVARKTANVVLGVWYKQAVGIVVDTHVQRVSQRLQLTGNRAPEKIEQDLMAIVPREQWIAYSHRVIWHGRQCCVARSPKCVACPIEKLCHAPNKTFSTV